MDKNSTGFIKRLLYFFILLSTSTLVLVLICFFKKGNIVYVDSMKVISEYRGTVLAKANYEKKTLVWRANVDTLTTELNNVIAKHEKDKLQMSAREKKLSEELIIAKQQQLQNYKNVISENASKEDQAVTAQVFKEITDFLNTYGKEHGYDYILGASGSGNVVYAKEGKNITDEVIKELNTNYRPLAK